MWQKEDMDSFFRIIGCAQPMASTATFCLHFCALRLLFLVLLFVLREKEKETALKLNQVTNLVELAHLPLLGRRKGKEGAGVTHLCHNKTDGRTGGGSRKV